MKFINKGEEPASFATWKALENEEWQPSYSELSNPEKRDVYNALLRDQGFICCYCESEITNGDYHLEHLNPQSAEEGDDLDFNNFLCSCLKNTSKGDPLHCGKEKADEILEVHPLQPNCQDYFTFTADGKIQGENVGAENSIRVLALDLGKLNDLRANALDPFLDPDLSEQELAEFVNKYIEDKEMLSPFISAVKCVFNGYIQR
ncbi:TIGR02646 family protein [Vibrio splendidus]|uniref:retron system putative HNH endonuclease n=1 Tax=Vibrio splendidus TaxID=29497 RepID=UPI003D11C888